MIKWNSRIRNILIGIIFIVVSIVLGIIMVNETYSMPAGYGKDSLVDLMNELYKYDCSLIEREDDSSIRHYVSNERCPFEIEFLEKVSYNDGHFNYYLDKVNDNGNGSKEDFNFYYNGTLMSKESLGVEYYKVVTYKDKTILYLTTPKILSNNAKEIVKNIGYRYGLSVKYIIIPILLFIVGVLLIVFMPKRKKMKKKEK